MLSLGVNGASFAGVSKLVNESIHFKDDRIDFNSYLLLYGKYSGLCKKQELINGINHKAIWIPTSEEWKQVYIISSSFYSGHF